MKRLTVFAAALTLIVACDRAPQVQGNAFASSPAPAGSSAGTAVATSGISSASAEPTADKPAVVEPAAVREVTIPAGTVLPVDLETSVGSDISRVEQAVTGRLRSAVTVGGAQVLPAGT